MQRMDEVTLQCTKSRTRSNAFSVRGWCLLETPVVLVPAALRHSPIKINRTVCFVLHKLSERWLTYNQLFCPEVTC